MDNFFQKIRDKLTKPKSLVKTGFINEWIGKWKYRRKEARYVKQHPRTHEEVYPAMERLTNQLIDETVGSRGVITQMMNRQLAAFSPDNPLSPKAAEAMLVAAVKMAVSRRKLLNERLANCVEIGSLYQNYFGRMQTMSSMMVDAYEKMEHMHRAEENYESWQQIYYQVQDKSFEEEFKPRMVPEDERKKREKDMLKAIDEEVR